MKNLKYALLAMLVVIAGQYKTFAQDSGHQQKTNIREMAGEQKIMFKAESINVRGGQAAPSALFNNTNANGPDNHITLVGDYKLSLKPESLSSFLPLLDDQYYKRPPGDKYVNPTLSPAGAKFSATRYKYAVKQQKGGSVKITISPEDNTRVRRFLLEVESDGKATLTVTDGRNNTFSYAGTVLTQG